MRTLLLIFLLGATLLKVATTEEKVEGEEAVVVKEKVEGEEVIVVKTSGREEEGEVPVVKTSTGKISGIREKTTEGKVFFSYYSIPYAKPPVGDLRFKDPQMISGWGGVRDGSSQPPMCPQLPTMALMIGQGGMEGEEDCLYLNIFTPKPKDERPHLPVMVFIHGGGYMAGSAAEYPPHVLLNEDIILVTVQYRLGVLGFMSTEDDVAPGNLGLKDQTLALSWIQRNVHKFGGDPLRVTLFGESAGASSVHFQILTPKSIGLFKRAILQSGTALCPWAMGAEHAAVAEFIGRVFNCTTDEGSEELISCLQEVDAIKIASLTTSLTEWLHSPLLLGPRVDGQYLPAHQDYLMKEGRHKRVDLISGVTQDDGAVYSTLMYANEMARSALVQDFVSKAPYSMEFRPEDVAPLNQTVMIFDRYLGGLHVDAEHADNVNQMFTDRHFHVCHDLTTQLYSATVAPYKNTTYRYELRHRGSRSFTDFYGLEIGKHWISHLDDLFYLFEGGDLFKPIEGEDDLRLREIMLKLWTNFAATGNPTPDDSLGFKWEPMKEGSMKYLALQPKPAMEDDYRQETRNFWYSLPLKQNIFLHPERVPNLVYTPIENTTATPAPTETSTTTPSETVIEEPPKKDEL